MDLIIGSGLAGATLAKNLKNHLILEKSKGLGGRLATRRIDQKKFDTGSSWLEPQILSFFNPREYSLVEGKAYFPQGMTSWFKSLDLNVKKEVHIEEIKLDKQVKLISEKREVFLGDKVILTCPLPQSLEILKKSKIPYDKALEEIEYEKALVFIAEGEPRQTDEFRIVAQSLKQLSSTGLCCFLKAELAEKYFSKTDGELMALFQEKLAVKILQIKRWRYARPKSYRSENFLKINEQIYLVGDYFQPNPQYSSLKSANDFLATCSEVF